MVKESDSGRLAIVFGDQLDLDAALIKGLKKGDTVLMMEVMGESQHVPSHIQRTVMFLSAMRHFAAELKEKLPGGVELRYIELDAKGNTGSFAKEIERAAKDLKPASLVCTEPGEWRVLEMIEDVADSLGLDLEVLPDEHFLTTREEFAKWADGRKSLTMEYFYREQRKKTGYLMTKKGDPVKGEWNLDKENRETFGKDGPGKVPMPKRFPMDDITKAVIKAVRKKLPDLPGELDDSEDFRWPVTRKEALAAFDDFIRNRLEKFGPFEDAMWTGEPVLYHSLISPAINLKLLNPRECCEKAIKAYDDGKAPLQSVEGFVRQLIGWREFIRGVYWFEGPGYGKRNALGAEGDLPEFYWTGETDMACLRETIGQVLEAGHNHHIPRLMVMGNFALLAGVHPRAITDWYLGMFVDGVDWVTTPNTLGMVMHADGRDGLGKGVTGVVGTKPYAASGQYIKRMSNFCTECRYDPGKKSGDDACPFSVLYWDFLIRNQSRFKDNQRMAMILKNVDRMKEDQRTELTREGKRIRKELGVV